MRIDAVTLFSGMIDRPLSESIVGRARKEGFLELGFSDPRDFATDRRRTVDDRPYGGGAGMIMMAEPLYHSVQSLRREDSYVVLLTPKGKVFSQKIAAELARKPHIILICGHYEGIDERITPLADLQLSIGDYVLTGGEPAAVVVIDAVARLIPGVLKKEEAPVEETFKDGLLEAPHYTRPAVWRGAEVPSVLMNGDHKKIAEWKEEQSRTLTEKNRPDLIPPAAPGMEDKRKREERKDHNDK